MKNKTTRLVVITTTNQVKTIKKSKVNKISNTAKKSGKQFIHGDDILRIATPYYEGCESILVNDKTFVTKTTHGHYTAFDRESAPVFRQAFYWLESSEQEKYWKNNMPKQLIIDFIVRAVELNKDHYDGLNDMEYGDNVLNDYLNEQFKQYELCKTQVIRDTFLKGMESVSW